MPASVRASGPPHKAGVTWKIGGFPALFLGLGKSPERVIFIKFKKTM